MLPGITMLTKARKPGCAAARPIPAGRRRTSDLAQLSGFDRKFRHYFYGARPRVVEQLIDQLQKRHPGLCVAGYRSPPFRPLAPAEDAADIAAIRAPPSPSQLIH
jgi:UDP-N-acetyl-D-mannosaminuronic acid transferase (WecB/TagA/CpsF family)